MLCPSGLHDLMTNSVVQIGIFLHIDSFWIFLVFVFFVVFCFQKFNYHVSYYRFLSTSIWNNPWLLRANHLWFSPELGRFCPLLLVLFCFFRSYFSLFWKSNETNTSFSVVVTQVPETITLFSPVYFFSIDQIGSTRLICSQVLWFYPVSSPLYLWVHLSFYPLFYFSLL